MINPKMSPSATAAAETVDERIVDRLVDQALVDRRTARKFLAGGKVRPKVELRMLRVLAGDAIHGGPRSP